MMTFHIKFISIIILVFLLFSSAKTLCYLISHNHLKNLIRIFKALGARFYHRSKFHLLFILPSWDLVVECLPQSLLLWKSRNNMTYIMLFPDSYYTVLLETTVSRGFSSSNSNLTSFLHCVVLSERSESKDPLRRTFRNTQGDPSTPPQAAKSMYHCHRQWLVLEDSLRSATRSGWRSL